mmetsp:Transcript_9356/g.15548  ORF Transcript_9356/g.15548 Transcript_9356/m.15548 type:complete len:137 (-) Transcript_9356:96-506(-)
MQNSLLSRSGGQRCTPPLACDFPLMKEKSPGVPCLAVSAMLLANATICRSALEASKRQHRKELQRRIWSTEDTTKIETQSDCHLLNWSRVREVLKDLVCPESEKVKPSWSSFGWCEANNGNTSSCRVPDRSERVMN